MSAKQPTFIQRIRLLECLVAEIRDASCDDFETHPWADVIEAEVARMKIANQRFEAKRSGSDQRPRTKKAPVKALHRVADETCESCQ